MPTWTFQEVDGRTSVFVHLPGCVADASGAVCEELHALTDDRWVHGRFAQHAVPRLVRWHSRTGKTYKFSGRTYASEPYPPALDAFAAALPDVLRGALPRVAGIGTLDYDALDSVLVNKYRGPRDSIAAHADNEPEFGEEPTIVSVSLGATRRFVVRPMTETQRRREWAKTGRPFVPAAASARARPSKLDLRLRHGDVLVMAGAAQEFWYHEVPKDKETPRDDDIDDGSLAGRKRPREAAADVRFNLTFRPRT